jgi:hypothetical protein
MWRSIRGGFCAASGHEVVRPLPMYSETVLSCDRDGASVLVVLTGGRAWTASAQGLNKDEEQKRRSMETQE